MLENCDKETYYAVLLDLLNHYWVILTPTMLVTTNYDLRRTIELWVGKDGLYVSTYYVGGYQEGSWRCTVESGKVVYQSR